MKMDLVSMAKKKYLVLRKEEGFYVPAKDYLVMYGDTMIAYVGFDPNRARWKAEDIGGGDYVYVNQNAKEFEVYKKVT